jgi:hypothetical protein
VPNPNEYWLRRHLARRPLHQLSDRAGNLSRAWRTNLAEVVKRAKEELELWDAADKEVEHREYTSVYVRTASV